MGRGNITARWLRELGEMAMTRIKHVAICAAVIASMTACGASVSPDASTVGGSVATSTTAASATACEQGTKDALRAAAQRRFGGDPNHPFPISQVLCVDDWAKVLIDTRSIRDANPPSTVLYHDDGNGWRAVQYGSGFDCTNEGVPPPIAAELEC